MSNDPAGAALARQAFQAYVAELTRAVSALQHHSDTTVAGTFRRLARTMALIGLKAEAGGPVTYDRQGDGFPVLSEILALDQALSHGAMPDKEPAALRETLLDEMLVRRRMPRPLQLQELARAVYLRELQAGEAPFGAQAERFVPVLENGYLKVAWDHWDGPRSTPVHTVAWFMHKGPAPFPAEALTRVARRVSGAAFTPLAAAIEFDDASETTRLKKLVRMPVGPYRSPAFTVLDGPTAELLASMDVDEEAFSLAFHIDAVVSTGTRIVGKGWFSNGVERETYAVDRGDALASERGSSHSMSHILIPHAARQRLHDEPGQTTLTALGNARIHALARDGGLIEDR